MDAAFSLPDLGEGIHEAEILDVCVAEGGAVQEGETIFQVETDKAVVEVPSPYTGTVTQIKVAKGDVARVGDVLITFTVGAAPDRAKPQPAPDDADAAPAPPPQSAATPAAAGPSPRPAAAVHAPQTSLTGNGAAARAKTPPVPASPSTRRLARELGVDLQAVPGSGPGGRVTPEDLQAYARQAADKATTPEAAVPAETQTAAAEPAAAQAAAPPPGRPLAVEPPPLPDFSRWGPVEAVPLQGVRRATARQMSLAWSQIPHVMHQDVADITELERFRQRHAAEVAQQGGKLSLTVLVLRAVVAALKRFPRFNASLDPEGGRLIMKHYYHIGVAVDTERGLLVPVVRDVDRKSLLELAVELPALVERARQAKVTPEEFQGGTFTLTNAGAIGGTAFTPLINYPEVAILGLARARLAPVVQGDVEHCTVVARWQLPIHLAFDHRVNDGADAARFVRALIDTLQDPEAFLLRV